MTLKNTWENGEQFNASDANDVATAVNGKYVKPAGGVPITDLTSAVQLSLGKADSSVQSVSAASITDSTATGRSLVTAADAPAARTTLGVSYGTTAGTVAQGNDARLSPNAAAITDSTVTGRAVLTAADAPAARTVLGVGYGTTAGTVVQGNDSRITGAEQTSNKGQPDGYASLDGGGKVPVAQLPNSIMEYQGTWNASTNSPSLTNGTGSAGDVYRVSVAGSRNFGAGSISFDVGDYVIYSGAVWEKSDTTDSVTSVAGKTGAVTLVKGDVGLGNVDNTSDATKFTSPTISGPTFTGTASFQTVSPQALNVSSVGYLGMPVNSQSAAYTLVAADAGKLVLHPSSDNNARTFTIPSNASVAFPAGTVVTFVNGVNTLTVAISSDTLTSASTGGTGSRTLAANGVATAIKTGATTWLISGVGLS